MFFEKIKGIFKSSKGHGVKKYIGLSVSFCIRDIVNGIVSADQVEKIIAGTCAPNPEVWDKVIKKYKETYWIKNPKKCEKVLREFIKKNKIEQPRLNGREGPDTFEGHWLFDGKYIRF